MAKWVDEIVDADDQTIVVLPLGATEQHGLHLPLETDSIIARGICDRLIAQLGEDKDVRFLPVEEITYSPEHMDHEGSQTRTFEETIKRWIALGEKAADAGAKRFILLNAHGGNSPLASIAVQELRVRRSILAVATKWDRFIKGSGVVSANEESFGIHGGDIETSVMLALAPDRVIMDNAREFPNRQEALTLDHKYLRAYGPHAFGWKAADLNPLGVTGNAGAATAEKGEALLKIAVEGMRDLILDVENFDLTLLKDA